MEFIDVLGKLVITSLLMLGGFITYVSRWDKNRISLRRNERNFLRSIAYINRYREDITEKEKLGLITRTKYRYYASIYGVLPLNIEGYELLHDYISRYYLHSSVLKNASIGIQDGELVVNKKRIAISISCWMAISFIAFFFAIEILGIKVQSWWELKPYIQTLFGGVLVLFSMWGGVQASYCLSAYRETPKILANVKLTTQYISPHKVTAMSTK